jgi:hypothetical protein
MSDTCKHCMICGNIVACRATPCHTHESWYAQQQDAEIERLRDALQQIANRAIPIQREEHRIARAALARKEET